jgi:hypothetical protein
MAREWHGGEHDDAPHLAETASSSLEGDAQGLGDHRLVGKSLEGSRQPGRAELGSAQTNRCLRRQR